MCDLGRRAGYSASYLIPVTTIQGRNGIFSDEESAPTCCVGAPPHKRSEEFRPVPSIASTIEHIGESRLGARDQSCIRPAIGAQTPWHDIRWLRLSLGTSICKRSPGVCFTDQDDAIGRQFLRRWARSEHPRTASELHSRRKSSRLGQPGTRYHQQ